MLSEDTDPRAARSAGLLGSLQQFVGTVAEVLHTRIEILAAELEGEGGRLRTLLLCEIVSLFFLGLGVLLVTFMVIVAFWDTHRVAVSAGFAGLYLVIGVGMALWVKYMRKRRPRLFSATLAELAKDRDHLAS